MLCFARETRLSETTFVQTASTGEADYRNRIWTVERELPFAGHPSLGTAVAVARVRGVSEARYVQQTAVGCQAIDVRLDGDTGHASMLQEPARFGAELDPAEVMAAVGLGAQDAESDLPPQFVSTGLETLIAPVARLEALARAVPDFERIDALQEPQREFNLYVVSCDPAHARARMFVRGIPGGEDPATGSAVGPLCAYLAERRGWHRVEVFQGVEMGRPSRLVAELEDGRPRVSGGVVVVIDGTVAL
jgi:trans-2,3-dihydro-3-hydroxyanthranilate isomerase